MDKFVIEGGHHLEGVLEIGGSKNASLPILMAALLCKSRTVFENVPDLRDTRTLMKILEVLGAQTKFEGHRVTIECADEGPVVAPYELVSTQRASFYALGALLGRRRQARVSLPGGCVIGQRPVDLHLKGFEALGVKIEIDGGYVIADASEARAAHVFLGGAYGSSVGATCNVLMLAATLDGTTDLDNAACEPEVAELCRFLNACGARVEGMGSPHLRVTGVPQLDGVGFTIAPDRIEAATFLVVACLSVGEKLGIRDVRLREHGALLNVLATLGFVPEVTDGILRMRRTGVSSPVECTTLPYPGFPTDVQAQLMVLLTQFPHLSVITEKVYPDRFMHMAELGRLGAAVRKEGPSALVNGGRRLSGAPVMASDLRASAALVMAGLVAEGITTVNRVYHIDRGYEQLDAKLSAVGAVVRRESA